MLLAGLDDLIVFRYCLVTGFFQLLTDNTANGIFNLGRFTLNIYTQT
jgi:hypothetical protein